MKNKIKRIRVRGIFHLKTSPHEEKVEFNFSSLKKLATTKEHVEILKLIEHEKIPDVRKAWVDYFIEKTKHSKSKGN